MKKFFVAIIILFLGLEIISCAPTPTARVAPPAAKTGYAHPEALIDTDWVAAHLTDPQVRLMDVSSKREVYGQGHLPGAVYVNLTTDLLNPLGAPNGQTPTQVQLESRLGQLGIRRETTCKVCMQLARSGYSNIMTTRMWRFLTGAVNNGIWRNAQ